MRSAWSPETALGWDEFLAIEPLPHEQICWMLAQLCSIYFNRTRQQFEAPKKTEDFMLQWGRKPMPKRQSAKTALEAIRGIMGSFGGRQGR